MDKDAIYVHNGARGASLVGRTGGREAGVTLSQSSQLHEDIGWTSLERVCSSPPSIRVIHEILGRQKLKGTEEFGYVGSIASSDGPHQWLAWAGVLGVEGGDAELQISS